MADLMAALTQHKIEDDQLARKAARAAYRIMAIKDEYEVARLMTSDVFKKAMADKFGKVKSVHYNVAPPLLGWIKNRNGTPKKFRIGGWLGRAFSLLAKMKGLEKRRLMFLAGAKSVGVNVSSETRSLS